MRYIVPVKPCEKCGSEMSRCETSGTFDTWGISECKNKECDNWKDASTLLKEGGSVTYA